MDKDLVEVMEPIMQVVLVQAPMLPIVILPMSVPLVLVVVLVMVQMK
jgi:hypothetical protein